MNDNYLMHYGVLGMKWGIRKDRRSSSGGLFRRKQKKKPSYERVVVTNRGGSEKKRTAKIEKQNSKKDTVRATAAEVYKNRNKYTNNELNDIITRLGYEQRLIELSAPKKSLGQKWVEDVFTESAKKLAISAINKTGNAIIDKALIDAGLKEKNPKDNNNNGNKKKKKSKDAFLFSDRINA